MTLNGVMAVTLRYFTELVKPAFQHNRFLAQERKFTFAISSADELLVRTLQAFVVIAIYNMARMKVGLIPIIVRLWTESMVALARAKVRFFDFAYTQYSLNIK